MSAYNKFKIVADPCQLLGEAGCIDVSFPVDRFSAPALPAPCSHNTTCMEGGKPPIMSLALF